MKPTAWSFVLVIIFSSTLAAQTAVGVPPDAFLITHLWGSPSAINVAHMAMGDASVGDLTDDWHGNPAGLMAVRRPTVLFSRGRTSFGLLPTFTVTGVGYAQAVIENRLAIKGTAFFVRADGPAAGLSGLHMTAQEDDAGIELAGRVLPHLSVGGGVAYLHTESSFVAEGVGTVTTLNSRPTGAGGRIGVLYDPFEWFSIGASYDHYSEVVSKETPLFALPRSETRFDSHGYRAGIATHPVRNAKVILEYESLAVDAPSTTAFKRDVWKIGAEYTVGPVALRGGLLGDHPTGGIAVQFRKTNLAYVITTRYDRDLPNFDAHPGHMIQLLQRF